MSHLPRLLEMLKSKDYIPLPLERLVEGLGLEGEDASELRREVAQHLKAGTLVKLKKNRLCLPRDADLLTGTIRFRQSGSAVLMVDAAGGGKDSPPLPISAEDTHTAMHGDRVVVRLNREPKRYREFREKRGKLPKGAYDAQSGRVIRILERARTTLTGTLRRGRASWYVISDEPRIIQDILVPDPATSRLSPPPQPDDKVVVRLHEWEQRHLNPEGEIIEVLGKTHTPMAEYKALLHLYNLDPTFPAAVQSEAKAIPPQVGPDRLQGRTDLRRHFVITIDPQDAKDFDDALSLEVLEDGSTRVGVHIADVAAYVRPGTALDTEARNRGNSTYLVGTVIPMLPHALSNGVCSLVEAEDRLTKSVFITYAAKTAKRLQSDFANSVIRSRKRLTYEQAYALLKIDDLEKIRALPVPPAHQTGSTGRPLASLDDDELRALQQLVRRFWDIASKLRKRRMAAGSLDLDMPETKIYVDAQGYADRLVKVTHDESHQLIEEFMLEANEAVDVALSRRSVPLLHRVHDKPEAERLEELSAELDSMGIETGDLTSRKQVSLLLQTIKAHPQSHALRTKFLRSLKQACYRATADGHYGLAKQHYAHFTSPIRRYADLVVHRLFEAHLTGGGRAAGTVYSVADLDRMARHLSTTEQNSTEAERESVKVKLLEFFERELAKKKRTRFAAVITDLKNHGMFVELVDSQAFGMVHSSSLQDDFYQLNKDGTRYVGRRFRRSFAIGQAIEVVVDKVDRFKRQVDFAVAG